jgi:hypothetical protein
MGLSHRVTELQVRTRNFSDFHRPPKFHYLTIYFVFPYLTIVFTKYGYVVALPKCNYLYINKYSNI